MRTEDKGRAGTGRRPPELLAPAGGPAAAFAAFQYGADAVYLGLPRFSARAEAENVTFEALAEIVSFAHTQQPPRKVYVAFNTLVQSRELGDALRSLQRLAEMEVDGLIVQDLGIARLTRMHFPSIPLHASTQMVTHNVAGVRALAGLGFTRVVLARELAIDEVRDIVRDGGLEVEVFIHGALCYSYSGLCLFSSHATGRSGNRGGCAYCCRATFGTGEGNTMPFSMKDLAMGDRLDALCAAGVASLKIEGRMKSALYVSALTDYHRRLLDGRLDGPARRELEEDIRTIFSRPWTRLHADGPAAARAVIDADTVGHRGALIAQAGRIRRERDGDWLEFTSRRALEIHDGLQIDLPGGTKPFGFAVDALRPAGRRATAITLPAGATVEVQLPADHPFIPPGAPVYCSSSQAVKRRYPLARPRPGVHRCRHPLRVAIRLGPDAMHIHATANIPSLGRVAVDERMDGPFEPARRREGTAAAAGKAFERLGDTDWATESVELDDPDGLFVPASLWNEARRRVAAALDAARDAARAARLSTLDAALAAPPAPRRTEEMWSLRFDRIPDDWAAADWAGVAEIVLPLAGVDPLFALSGPDDMPLRAAVQPILRAAGCDVARRQMAELLRVGWRRWEVAGLAGLELLHGAARAAGIAPSSLDITSDWSVHTLNGEAAAAGHALGIGRFVTSPEDDRENLTSLLHERGDRALVLLFQFSPLFEAATAPAVAPADHRFRGRRGERYVEVEDEGVHVLIAASPFSLSAHVSSLRSAGARGFRADFCRAAAAGCDMRATWRLLRAGETIPGSHEGNYTRGLR